LPKLEIEDEYVRSFAKGLLSAIETPKFLGLRNPSNPDSIISPSDESFSFWVRNESGVPVWNNTLYQYPPQFAEEKRAVIASDGSCLTQRETKTFYFGKDSVAQMVQKEEGWEYQVGDKNVSREVFAQFISRLHKAGDDDRFHTLPNEIEQASRNFAQQLKDIVTIEYRSHCAIATGDPVAVGKPGQMSMSVTPWVYLDFERTDNTNLAYGDKIVLDWQIVIVQGENNQPNSQLVYWGNKLVGEAKFGEEQVFRLCGLELTQREWGRMCLEMQKLSFQEFQRRNGLE
jgi:hypothetical protein